MQDLNESLNESLNELTSRAHAAIECSGDLVALDDVRVAFLGKKGELTAQLKSLGTLSAAERPAAVQAINEAKRTVQAAIEARRDALESVVLADQLKAAAVDVTLTGRGQTSGGLHPVTRTRARIEAIFAGAGFAVAHACG